MLTLECLNVLTRLPGGDTLPYKVMPKTATLTVQQWGNSLAVRIPAVVARSAHFAVGQPVELTATESGVTVKALGPPRLSLAQKLAAFDPVLHSGEAMVTAAVGKEAL